MGMGGAFTALSDDASGIIFNPAGLALGAWAVDAGGTHNKVNNKEFDVTGNGDGFGLPYSFLFYGGAIRLGGWVLGAGVSSPYHMELESYDLQTKLVMTSVDVLLARRFGKKFSIGVTVHTERLQENFAQPSTGTNLETESVATYPTIGISTHGNKAGFGAAYTTGREHSIDDSLNNQTGATVWFRDVSIPSKLSVGIFYKLLPKITAVVDVDIIDSPDGAIYVGSGLGGDSDAIVLDKRRFTILHGGFEWKILESKGTDITWRAGAYREPSRFNGHPSRDHLTLGLEVRFGPAVLSVAYDQARNFTNTSQGFSLSLDNL